MALASFALTNTAASRKLEARTPPRRGGPKRSLTWWWPPSPTPTPSRARAISLAAIAWGDGHYDVEHHCHRRWPGSLLGVLGTHTYVDAGTRTFSVQVTDNRCASATATSTATVTANANTESPSPVLTIHRDGVEQFDDLTSLREAVAYANSHPGPDTISFDPAPSSKKRWSIKLSGGPLVLTNPATTTDHYPTGSSLLTINLRPPGLGVLDIEGGSQG